MHAYRRMKSILFPLFVLRRELLSIRTRARAHLVPAANSTQSFVATLKSVKTTERAQIRADIAQCAVCDKFMQRQLDQRDSNQPNKRKSTAGLRCHTSDDGSDCPPRWPAQEPLVVVDPVCDCKHKK
jgi:hypothetical protein